MEFMQYRKVLLAIGLSLGNFMTAMSASIVTVAIPSIMQYFHASILTAGWIAMAPLVTITGLIIPVGKLADMVGRKRIYLLGGLVFLVGSLLCGTSHSMAFLIAASVLQAVGAAAIFACTPAILSISFPPGQIGKALGLIGLGVSLGGLLGPAAGGYIIQYAGWRFVYLAGVPVWVINFLLVRWILSDDTPEIRDLSFDISGAVSFFLFTLFFILALNKGADLGLSSPAVLVMGLISALSMLFFIRREIRTANPMVNLRIFRNTMLTISIISRVLFFMLLYIFNFTIPFYLQQVLHYPPSKMGLILSPVPLIRLVSGPLGGWISDSIGTRWLTTIGMLMSGLMAALLTTMGNSASSADILLRFILFGLGMGIFTVPNMSALLGSVDQQDVSFASSSIGLFRTMGMALGIAAANVVINLSLPGAKSSPHAVNEEVLLAALENSWWLAAALGFMGAAVSLMKESKKQ